MLNSPNTQRGVLLVCKDVGPFPVNCNTLRRVKHRKRMRTEVLAGILTAERESACRPGTQ